MPPPDPRLLALLQEARQHHDNRRFQQAEVLYQQILTQQPDYAEALVSAALLAHQTNRQDLAIHLLRRGIAADPNRAEIHGNLGLVLGKIGRLQEAIVEFQETIRLGPHLAGAHANLGKAYMDLGRFQEATASYANAVAQQPQEPEWHVGFGNTRLLMNDRPGAKAAYQRALALAPNNASANMNLGYVLREEGNSDKAIAYLRRAVELAPANAAGWNNLGNALGDTGQLDEAMSCYERAVSIDPNQVQSDSNRLFTLLYHPGYDQAARFREHLRWNERHALPLKHLIAPHANDRSPDRRLRIGYVSPDLRAHPVGRFMLPLFANHDHAHHEIFCYSSSRAADALTEQIRGCADAWREVGLMSDDSAAQQIRDDRIDILVDLSLHMDGNRMRLFARKPAPVQVTYLAYCGTSGMTAIDYRLTDPYLDPPGLYDAYYSEKSVHLPRTYWCYEPLEQAPAVIDLPALKAGHITFGCFNNFIKVSPGAWDLWARILREVPNSRLIVYSPPGSHRERAQGIFAAQEIDPARVTFVARMKFPEYFEQYQRTDIALDPFPFVGGTTTCDALWMGVPVVTFAGDTATGRGGVSILSNVNLPELIARDPEQYLQIAKDLAGDVPRLVHLRSTLRERVRQSPLMDAPTFARDVEAAYRQMWRRWCEAGT